ncbi:MAG: hypothetical protein ABGY42_09735 [bacterium]
MSGGFFVVCGGSNVPIPTGEISWIEIEANGFVLALRAAGPEDVEAGEIVAAAEKRLAELFEPGADLEHVRTGFRLAFPEWPRNQHGGSSDVLVVARSPRAAS